MTKHIGLMEADALIDSMDNPQDLIGNEEIQQFIDDIEDAGIEILKSKDEEYIRALVTFVRSAVIAGAMMHEIKKGNFDDALEVMSFVNSSRFEKLIAFAVKYTIGLSVIEELH